MEEIDKLARDYAYELASRQFKPGYPEEVIMEDSVFRGKDLDNAYYNGAQWQKFKDEEELEKGITCALCIGVAVGVIIGAALMGFMILWL